MHGRRQKAMIDTGPYHTDSCDGRVAFTKKTVEGEKIDYFSLKQLLSINNHKESIFLQY